MTVEETINEYEELLSARKSSWSNGQEEAIVYLAHAINRISGKLDMVLKEMRKSKE